MEIDAFIKKFSDQFEETDSNIFQSDIKFRDLEEWSSFTAMAIIAMVDEEYNVKLTGEDIRKSVTIRDIFKIIESRIK
jgi:acyl carrier protein